MKKQLNSLLVAAFAALALPATAHHSFAIYDMSQNIEFEGVVETVKMRNPHMALTLTVTKADGMRPGCQRPPLPRRGLRPAERRARDHDCGCCDGYERRRCPMPPFLRMILNPNPHRAGTIAPVATSNKSRGTDPRHRGTKLGAHCRAHATFDFSRATGHSFSSTRSVTR